MDVKKSSCGMVYMLVHMKCDRIENIEFEDLIDFNQNSGPCVLNSKYNNK